MATVQVNARIDAALKKAIEEYCKTHGVVMNHFIQEALLDRLEERGARRVLVEGGGALNAAFVEAGLVDELFVTIAPALLGGGAAPTPVDGAGLGMGERMRLALESVREVDGELFCHYLVVGKGARAC